MRLFYYKQITESVMIKDETYTYIAQCVFTKNGKKQIWEYSNINGHTEFKKLQ